MHYVYDGKHVMTEQAPGQRTVTMEKADVVASD